MTKIVIPGVPIAKKRPKFFVKGSKKGESGKTKYFVGAYNPQDTEEGKAMWEIKSQWMPRPMICGPVRLKICFVMPIGQSESKKNRLAMNEGLIKHIKKPDLDNLEKFVKDCMKFIVYKDDSQVVDVDKRKIYETAGYPPSTIIRVEEFEANECLYPLDL